MGIPKSKVKELNNRIHELNSKGYTTAKIAEILNITECYVVRVLRRDWYLVSLLLFRKNLYFLNSN